MDGSKILITGANGQIGRALKAVYPEAKFTDRYELDITDQKSLDKFAWHNIRTIVNAAGYTNVDGAETPEGRALAEVVNDKAIASLAEIANNYDLLLVHVSTAYVFDGTKKTYKEDDQINPLGVYAKTKAAGEKNALTAQKHYIIRTDSVIGDGKNFVRTMLDLGKKGMAPTVVADQIIRPSFASEIARAIKFLIDKNADSGVYNVTNAGEPVIWADFAREIFKQAGFDIQVKDTTYQKYSVSKDGVAPRPLNSVLDLSKIESLGFKPHNWRDDLREYIKKEISE